MKKIPLAAAALLALAMPFAASLAHAAAQSFQGTVSDSMCGKKHMMPGKSDAECTKACVKEGADYVLVTDKEIYTLKGKPDQLQQYAGKKVTVQGDLTQKTITVSSIK